MAKEKKKRVNPYTVLDRDKNTDEYALLDTLIGAHHPHLVDAKIGLAWRQGFKEDPDGRIILGQCRKASALQQKLHGLDFVIVLNVEFWSSPRTTQRQRTALLDHELCHASVAIDKDGEEKTDAHGRPIWRTRKHDLEEFREIVTRHGLYKSDLQAFAQAIRDAKHEPLLEAAAVAEVAAEPDLRQYLKALNTTAKLLAMAEQARKVLGGRYAETISPLVARIKERMERYNEVAIQAAIQVNGEVLAETGARLDAVFLAAALHDVLVAEPAADGRKTVSEFASGKGRKPRKKRTAGQASSGTRAKAAG